MKYRVYKFKGKELLKIQGALATKSDYEHGRESYAHLQSNGEIWRYHKKIGTKKDLKFIGWTEADVNLGEALVNILGWGFGW